MHNIIAQSLLNREFEYKVAELIRLGEIKIPSYLSLGQTHIPPVLKSVLDKLKLDPTIFPSHRNHSIYLSFTQDYLGLKNELLGRIDGCSKGYGGSASIGADKLVSHDGFLGSNIPIGVGFAQASNKLTVVCAGDAAFEEDYALGALSFAGTHRPPVLFICFDNDLSILSPKFVRRSWNLVRVAQSFGLSAEDISDKVEDLEFSFRKTVKKLPYLLNIRCKRSVWHVGGNLEEGPDYPSELVNKYQFPQEKVQQIKDYIGELFKPA
ncbi:MAG: thiamine pyrophosphate-dependent enzyme [Nitrososphaerales archaeon]